MRIGAKGRPFYRIVVVDERKKRTGGYIDLIGTYNPLTNPKEIKINQTKVEEWVKKGAQLSDGFLRITKQAPQKPERKVRNPGKLRSNTPVEEPAVEEAPAAEETTSDEAATEEVTETVENTPEVQKTQETPAEEQAAEVPAESTEEETKTESASDEPMADKEKTDE